MRFFKKLLPIAVVVILWAIGSSFVNPMFLPSPGSVIEAFITMAGNGTLFDAGIASFTRITIATLLSALVGIPLALLVSNYKFADSMITPVTGFMRYVPVTAFYPILMLWLGIDETMKIAFLFIATFFVFMPSVVLTIRQTERDLIDTALTMGMSKLQMILRVQLPHSFPSICQTFLMIYSVGWTYVLIAEVINAEKGLGHIMNIATARGRPDIVFVGIITIFLISYIFDNVGTYIIRKLFSWKFAKEIGD